MNINERRKDMIRILLGGERTTVVKPAMPAAVLEIVIHERSKF